mgnify:CR=1 FL=1
MSATRAVRFDTVRLWLQFREKTGTQLLTEDSWLQCALLLTKWMSRLLP